jgi:hypothetical protein
MTIAELFTYVRDGGTIAILVLFIAGMFKGWIVFRRELDELLRAKDEQIDARDRLIEQERAEKEYWRAMTFRLVPMLNKTVDLATTAAASTPPPTTG